MSEQASEGASQQEMRGHVHGWAYRSIHICTDAHKEQLSVEEEASFAAARPGAAVTEAAQQRDGEAVREDEEQLAGKANFTVVRPGAAVAESSKGKGAPEEQHGERRQAGVTASGS